MEKDPFDAALDGLLEAVEEMLDSDLNWGERCYRLEKARKRLLRERAKRKSKDESK